MVRKYYMIFRHVVVGSGCGRMNLIDLRNPGRILNTYKGFTGGITDLSCSNSEALIASVSLDRYFRIHRLDTKELIKKVKTETRRSFFLLNFK